MMMLGWLCIRTVSVYASECDGGAFPREPRVLAQSLDILVPFLPLVRPHSPSCSCSSAKWEASPPFPLFWLPSC